MCMYFVYLFRFIYFTNKLTDRPHDRKKGLTQPPNQTANLMYKYSIIYIIDIYIYISGSSTLTIRSAEIVIVDCCSGPNQQVIPQTYNSLLNSTQSNRGTQRRHTN